MKIPYIKIKQRSETFYVTKMKLTFLLDHLNFHFRDPYNKYERKTIVLKDKRYIETIVKMGIDLKSTEEGVQRRLQISRINSIRDYIEGDSTNFLPNSVLLSADVSELPEFEEEYLSYEEKEIGTFVFPDEFVFSIIDGQHRLAGLSLVDDELKKEFEVPAIILFNVSKPTAAKLFADINGKQKSVNKSLIYDLYSELNEKDFEDIKKFHSICENFYKKEQSPLYRQIKMLGIGSGAISQAFFIDYVKDAVNKTDLAESGTQVIFDNLFFYFKAFQKTFPEDWPVPLKFKSNAELDEHADKVLKERKSQLVKTNGFGAILRAFPYIYSDIISKKMSYSKEISRLENKIEWIPGKTTGTGKAFQNSIFENILEILKITQ